MPARQPSLRRLLATAVLLSLVAPAARAAELPPADADAELLAQQIEAELTRLRQFTAAFASDPLFRHHEHWYRPWQDNAIVQLMDRTVASLDGLLLTQLVDLDGQLVAVNAHGADKLPVDSQTLYLDDFRQRPWFLALAAAGAQARSRIEGPVDDPDVARVFVKEDEVLRVTVPVFAGQRLVAVLSHCLRFAPLAARVAEAARAPGAEPGSAVALFDGAGDLIAGDEPALGSLDCDVIEYPITAGGEQRWTLRAYLPQAGAWQRSWRDLRAIFPTRAELTSWPARAFGTSALVVLTVLAFGFLRRRRGALPSLTRVPFLKRRRPLLRRAPRPAAYKPAPLPKRPPMAAPRAPLTPAEKAYELLAAILGSLQGTLHALADGSEAIAEHRRDPLGGRGPGSALQALRRAAGLSELLRGLENHARHCREDAALAPELKQVVDVFARLGREIEALMAPLGETEARLARLPRSGLRAGADAQTYAELTGALHRTVGVMTALQSGLGRLSPRGLRGESLPGAAQQDWQEAAAELQDLLLTLARELGATCKLLELLPTPAVSSVISVRDVSAASGQLAPSGAAASAIAPPALAPAAPPPDFAAGGARPIGDEPTPLPGRPAAAAPAPAFEMISQRPAPAPSAPPRFEILGGRRA
ncbi:hypothetical protein FJ251_01545 [bacterium]|nr:hypothetical protein [bacterium]